MSKALRILMRVSCTKSIKAGRVEFGLHRSDFLCRHKDELSFWIDKALNEPAGCSSIDLNSLASDPLHCVAPTFAQLAYRSSTVAAKTSVPRTPMIPAVIKGTCGVILHSRPPIAAAGVIERLRTR